MYQTFVKIVQVGIFGGVVFLFLADKDAPNISGAAIAILAGTMAFLVTVVPCLIWMMVKNIIADVRQRLSARTSSQPTRIEPVFPKALDDGISDRRILGDSRPRIGK